MQRLSREALVAKGEELKRIIREREITSVFQPIVSLRDGSVLGYEALSRGPTDTEMESPDMLFAVAEEVREIWELERLCRTKALSAVMGSHVDSLLFLKAVFRIFCKGAFCEEVSDFKILGARGRNAATAAGGWALTGCRRKCQTGPTGGSGNQRFLSSRLPNSQWSARAPRLCASLAHWASASLGPPRAALGSAPSARIR